MPCPHSARRPGALVYRTDMPVPVPGRSEVLIKAAAGVNNTDINTRIGWYSKGEGDVEDASWEGRRSALASKAPIFAGKSWIGEGADSRLIGTRVLVEPCLREANGETLPSPGTSGPSVTAGLLTM